MLQVFLKWRYPDCCSDNLQCRYVWLAQFASKQVARKALWAIDSYGIQTHNLLTTKSWPRSYYWLLFEIHLPCVTILHIRLQIPFLFQVIENNKSELDCSSRSIGTWTEKVCQGVFLVCWAEMRIPRWVKKVWTRNLKSKTCSMPSTTSSNNCKAKNVFNIYWSTPAC